MIQFKRGSSKSWLKLKKPLEAGQPGYDKDRHKLKIGDGEKSWAELPYASGLSSEEILSSEKEAKVRRAAALLINPLAALLDSPAVITYGKEDPDKDTIGEIYLQQYNTAPEVDYIVSYGTDGIWTYQKWNSGIAKCWGTTTITTAVQSSIESVELFSDNKAMKAINYPFTFKKQPCETATLQSSGGITWLASEKANSDTHSATYRIMSIDKHQNSSNYKIALSVEGRWK